MSDIKQGNRHFFNYLKFILYPQYSHKVFLNEIE